MIEIVKAKRKDRFRSLVPFVDEMRSRGVSTEDCVRFFVDRLMELGRTLSPSIAENVVGMLGNVPLPTFVNPVGILASTNALRQFLRFNKDYAWFITLNDLADLGRRRRA